MPANTRNPLWALLLVSAFALTAGPVAAQSLESSAQAFGESLQGRSQLVDATQSLNLSAGEWKFNVFLGRSLSWRATMLSWYCEC